MNVLMKSTLNGKIVRRYALLWRQGGYPVSYKKGYEISGLDNVGDLTVFHAGTAVKDGKIVTNGGRSGVTAVGSKDLDEAIKNALCRCCKISWTDEFHRSDIV